MRIDGTNVTFCFPIKGFEDGEVYEFNDEQVNKVTTNKALKEDAYMMFFEYEESDLSSQKPSNENEAPQLYKKLKV